MLQKMTTLKRKHSLQGTRITPAIKQLRNATYPSTYASITPGKQTKDMTKEEINRELQNLCGETLTDILELANVEDTLENARLALHCFIVFANEFGQPKGQNLVSYKCF